MKVIKILMMCTLLLACDDKAESAPEDITTADGWVYRYVNIPKKKNGWKIEIHADSAWDYDGDHNAWASILGPHMLNYSGYDDVSPADKAALFEDLNSNAVMYQAPSSFVAELYVEKGEEDAFFEAVIAMLHNYTLDEEYFEDLKTQIGDNIRQLEAQKDSAYISEKIMSYAFFEQDNNVISAYDLTIEELDDLSLEDVQAWIDYCKSLSGFRIGIAGAENPETLNDELDKLFEGFSQSSQSVDIPELKPAKKYLRIAYENPETEKSVFNFSSIWPGAIVDDEDYYVLDFSAGIESGVKTNTRLASIREELRASYGFSSFYSEVNATRNLYGIGGESDLEHQQDVLQRLLLINQNMVDEPPSQNEFDAVKSASIDAIKEARQDENYAAYSMALTLDDRLGFDWTTELPILEKFQLEDFVARIAEDFPPDGTWHEVIVTPDASHLEADCVIDDWRKVPSCYE